MLVVIFLFSSILAAYTRGDYLLGRGVGVVYAIVASMLAVLFYRAFSDNRTNKLQLGALTVTTVIVTVFFAFPGHWNWNVQISIDDHAEERAAETELARLFATDPAFGRLDATARHQKGLWVRIKGVVPTQADYDRLRQQVQEECELGIYREIDWCIAIREKQNTSTEGGDD